MDKKKLGIIGIIVLVILIIISCTINPDKEKSSNDNPNTIVANATEESNNIKEEEKKDFIEINVGEYISKYNGEEKTLVLVGRPTCHYCQIAEPILKNINYKYDLNINYLNIDNFQDGDGEKFINTNEYFSEGFGTPLLLVISNGSINDIVDGLSDTEHYIDFLKQNEFIN